MILVPIPVCQEWADEDEDDEDNIFETDLLGSQDEKELIRNTFNMYVGSRRRRGFACIFIPPAKCTRYLSVPRMHFYPPI